MKLKIQYMSYPIEYHLRWESLTKYEKYELLADWYTDGGGEVSRKKVQFTKAFNNWFKQNVSVELLNKLLEELDAAVILDYYVKLYKESPNYIDEEITQLYRYYKDDTLLYVGISLNTIQRQTQHKYTADWYDEVTSMTVEKFNTRKEALAAEKKAIILEKPLYNKTHNIDQIDLNLLP